MTVDIVQPLAGRSKAPGDTVERAETCPVRTGDAVATVCPACGSSQAWPLAAWLDRTPTRDPRGEGA